MKNMEDGPSLSGSTQTGYPETPMTLEAVLSLLGLKDVPDFLSTIDMKAFAVTGMMSILKRHDEAWVKENRVRLIEELEQISEM